ncbi:caspase family protein [Flammeovirga sp. SubArs3]|uniref:caspase family protein n=1 Tax=Flammeovirga sp. SubArs3 TaxID=2995316 RepID=UPI00248CEC4C|nr:caspase family protein [Flammeovirga sp. SubArs3]
MRKTFFLYIVLLFSISQLATAQRKLHLTLSQGHVGEVVDMALSNDARLLATVGEGGALKIWNINEKRLLDTFYPHTYGVATLCFSEDANYMATAGKDHSIKVWDLSTGEMVFNYDNLHDDVFKMEFVQEYLLFITNGGAIYRFDWNNQGDAPDGQAVKSDFGNFSAIKYNPHVKWLTAGYMNGSILTWRGFDKENIRKQLHTDWVSAIDFIEEDSLIVTGSWDKTIKIWDINSDSIRSELASPDGLPIVDLVYTSYFKILCVKTKSNKIYFYEVKGGVINPTPAGVRDDFLSMKFTQDARHAAFTHSDGSFSVWSLEKQGKSVEDIRWKPMKGYPVDGFLNGLNGALTFLTSNGNIHLWIPKKRTVSIVKKAHRGTGVALTFSVENDAYFTCGTDSLIKRWDRKGNLVDSVKINSVPTSIAEIPTREEIVFADESGDVYLWNSAKEILEKVYGHQREVIKVVNSRDGKLLASICSDRTLIVYDIDAHKVIFETKIRDISLYDLSFSSNASNLLVSGKHNLFLYDIDNWQLKKQKEYNEGANIIKNYPHNNGWVISDLSGTITLWDNQLEEVLNKFDQNSTPIIELLPYDDQPSLFAIRRNMTFEIWQTQLDEQLGKVAVTESGDWVLEHKSGLFDVGDLNMDNIYYVYGEETIDFEQLREKYWEPGLAIQLLEGKSLRKVPPLKSVDLFPKTTIQELENYFWIEVIDRGGGVGTISLYVNNKEVIHDLEKSAQKAFLNDELYYKVKSEDIAKHFIKGKENKIKVIATNSQGTLSGRGLTLNHKDDTGLEEREPTMYGVMVGVSDYRGRLMDLKYAADDASAIATSLELGSEKLFGVKNTNIQLLTTDSDSLQPTKENIKNAFKKISEEASASDILFVFLAGHGAVQKNHNGKDDFHFLTKDMINSDLTDPNVKENYTINGTELMQWIQDIPISKQVFVIDACHAGSFSTELITSRNDNEEGMKKRALERVRSRTGMFMLSGASSDKVSYESSFLEHGLLTYSLLDYLKSGDLKNGRFIDVQELFTYAVETVPELASEMQGEQQPEYRMPLGAGSFYIGELDEEDRDNISLSSQKYLISDIDLEDGGTWADQLELSKALIQRLNIESELKSLNFKFRKGAQGTSTYKLRGKYKVVKNTITVKLHLIHEKEVIQKWQVKSKNTEECLREMIQLLENHFSEN